MIVRSCSFEALPHNYDFAAQCCTLTHLKKHEIANLCPANLADVSDFALDKTTEPLMTFLYKADPVRGAVWAELFARKMPELRFHIWPETGDPREVCYLAAWQPLEDLATRFPNLEVLFSTGAGTDQFDFSVIPETLPVVRMVEKRSRLVVAEARLFYRGNAAQSVSTSGLQRRALRQRFQPRRLLWRRAGISCAFWRS